ncbi:MAG TPA: hypothetical protein VFF58_00645 [Candidatus Nitrosotalea sp.]|nr:hypothetical protein [Candidatus Nitrosotalea sp.]
MCPFAVDEDRMQSKVVPGQDAPPLLSLDPHKPPTKSIPHMEFPRVVYKHPLEPFTTIEHRNARHELVEEEVVATTHLTRTVADKKELELALKEGWVLAPYIAPPLPDRRAGLYIAPPLPDRRAGLYDGKKKK